MQYFIIITGYSRMPSLMVLIAVITADKLHIPLFIQFYLIHIADANTFAIKSFC